MLFLSENTGVYGHNLKFVSVYFGGLYSFSVRLLPDIQSCELKKSGFYKTCPSDRRRFRKTARLLGSCHCG